MSNPLLYPKLRWPIDIRVEKTGSQDVLVINCPIGVTPQPLALIAAVAPIVASFQGDMTAEQIAGQFIQYGIKKELVEQLASLLDEHYFMDTPRFHSAREEGVRQFKESRVREAALAGLGYSSDKETLGREIAALIPAEIRPSTQPMIALVSPHIDYRRGGKGYGKTYAHLPEDEHDLFVVLGTAHQYSEHIFHLTTKDFACPLGDFPCDREFVNAVASAYGQTRSFEDEYLHKREHSIELQLPFLRLRNRHASIVPILVGSFHGFLRTGKPPVDFEPYERFVDALSRTMTERIKAKQKVCIVAGVDMAHVGRHFGDSDALTPAKMKELADKDQAYLDAVTLADKVRLYEHMLEDKDARKICGFPAVYTMLDTLSRLSQQLEGKVFDYSQAVDYSTDCAVTFSGIGLYGNLL